MWFSFNFSNCNHRWIPWWQLYTRNSVSFVSCTINNFPNLPMEIGNSSVLAYKCWNETGRYRWLWIRNWTNSQLRIRRQLFQHFRLHRKWSCIKTGGATKLETIDQPPSVLSLEPPIFRLYPDLSLFVAHSYFPIVIVVAPFIAIWRHSISIYLIRFPYFFGAPFCNLGGISTYIYFAVIGYRSITWT